MDDFMSKMMLAKQIMNKHEGMERGSQENGVKPVTVNEEKQASKPISKPQSGISFKNLESSKLPDEIKKLMLEKPISPPSMPNNKISSENFNQIAEMMKKENLLGSGGVKTNTLKSNDNTEDYLTNIRTLKKMLREVIEEVLYENDLIVETTKKAKETIQFKIGKTIFEGQITKIRKIK